MRAHKEWTRNKKNYGNSEWNYSTNQEALSQFFQEGADIFGHYDNLCTIGMRGDGDATMLPEGSTLQENIDLLKEVITEQKRILSESKMEDKPTMLALYKEVEDYWYGGRENGKYVDGLNTWSELDDTIVRLCDDNYGYLRTVPR